MEVSRAPGSDWRKDGDPVRSRSGLCNDIPAFCRQSSSGNRWPSLGISLLLHGALIASAPLVSEICCRTPVEEPSRYAIRMMYVRVADSAALARLRRDLGSL